MERREEQGVPDQLTHVTMASKAARRRRDTGGETHQRTHTRQATCKPDILEQRFRMEPTGVEVGPPGTEKALVTEE